MFTSDTHMLGRAWEYIETGVSRLTVTQTATIGGAASTASITAGIGGMDALNAMLQTTALAAGALGGILTVGLLCLKTVQQRREMTSFMETMEEKHRADNDVLSARININSKRSVKADEKLSNRIDANADQISALSPDK